MNISSLSSQFGTLPGFGLLSLREEDLWLQEQDYPASTFCVSTTGLS